MKINARRMLTGRGLLVTVVAAGVLAGGGATAAVAAAPGDDPAPRATRAGEGHDGGAPETAVSLAQAVDAALKAAPGTVAEIELDDEQGRTAWEADVVAENGERREVTVDAADGKVLANRADDRDGDDRDGDDGTDDPAALRGAKVTAAAAADAALKAVPGRVTSAGFETEHGKAVWEVDVAGRDGAEHELTIDAAGGKVLTNEVDED
ncbi:PepSY domain-containing protein [Actinomadura bangladeshensis]|uniref:Peptidase M4 n=1 Tax=Actinomadura bangladeshensis TaxID=453573 RepID=A0A4R4NVH0_9ACTN|nr:PepSY domain-containing protein [Actinomadura bangladeshensis]TDC12103.1 peptidase M4 [Actinomadura bangladeshensis]